ncbi:MAG: threonylcarbamoyl-AMP synthase [Acidobacteriia bacterium]|nr:threonylcarbamoyl-AMP synthase [Terriglobia bacterium]
MPTRILTLNPEEPRADRLLPALEDLRAGRIVSLPTETFYGLSVDPFDTGACARVNDLKKKPRGSPMLLLLSGPEQIERVAGSLPESFGSLTGMFWPGPLSLVVPAGPALPQEVTGGLGTVGVRVPGLALPRLLAAAFGRPITGVSANLMGHPPCRTAAEVAEVFPEGVSTILDGGPSTGGAPSTVLDLTGPFPRVLREGAIPVSALRPFLSDLRRS